MIRQVIGGIAMLGMIVLVGCSGGPAPQEAKGVLTWEDDGKPIPGASTRLVPKDSGNPEVIATSGQDGAFTLRTLAGKPGAPKGEYTVVVSQSTASGELPGMTGQMSPEELAKKMKEVREKQKTPAKSPIPAIYSDASKSTLTLKIDGPTSNIELKLKKS